VLGQSSKGPPRDREFSTWIMALILPHPELLVVTMTSMADRHPMMMIVIEEGKDLLPEFAQSTVQKAPVTTCTNDSGNLLQTVHREVVESFAANAASGSGSGPVTDIPVCDDQSFSKFVQDLAKSGSDKSLYIQKKYKQFMEPIVEIPVAEEDEPSGERVNLEGSESEEESTDQSAGNDGHGYVMGVLALAAPSLEHEHTAVILPMEGPISDIDCSQDGLGSQVIDDMETDVPIPDARFSQRDRTRTSDRIAAQPDAHTRVEDRARQNTASRNLSGTNLNSSNSFSVLDNESIYTRALEMGIDPSSFQLENIDCLKDLEIARHHIDQKLQEKNDTPSDSISQSPLLLGFGESESDSDGFTPVLSKSSRKKMKAAARCRISVQQKKKESVRSGGAQSKSSAASVKAHSYHLLCDIVAGSRIRKRNPKYL
jgi:hypothetical protein